MRCFDKIFQKYIFISRYKKKNVPTTGVGQQVK